MADPEEFDVRLAEFLEAELDREGLEVNELRQLSGGASRQTWSFELADAIDGSTENLVMQRVRPGVVGGNAEMVAEAMLVGAAGARGVPVAGVVAASDDPAVVGSPFLVTRWLEGETLGRRVLRDDAFAGARAVLLGQCAAALAAIHALPAEAGPHLRVQEPVGQLRALMDAMRQPHPAFELALRWLDDHRPPPCEPSVVHGDFRLGNLMVGTDGLCGVLDWELAHLGDPVEDLGWMCVRAWRFGSDLAAAGLGTHDQLCAAYGDASGRDVDVDSLRWWEVLGTLRWGVICMLQASSHLQGTSRSVELAAIGRRVCENEYDLMALMGMSDPSGHGRAGHGQVDPGRPTADQPAPDLHGTPSALELVEAVREFLDGDVMGSTQGRVRFHARVAGRVLSMVERELAEGTRPVEAHRDRLGALGFDDDAGLAAAIRSGALDRRLAEVGTSVWLDVVSRVRVANPGYLLAGDRPDA